MELNIGTSIRRLRQEKNTTQEDLASAIGVTAQAVSRWERAEGYPDITLMPKIARYFGVSLDAVYGMDAGQEKKEIRSLISRVRGSFPDEDTETILREGLGKYPGSFALMAELADVLTGKNIEEALRLYEDILDRCTNQEVRNQAYTGICRAYDRAGRHKEAVRAAEKLPDLTQTSADLLSRILTGEKLTEHVQRSLSSAVSMMYGWIRRMANTEGFGGEERIRLYEKILELHRFLTDDETHPILIRNEMLWLDIAGEKIALGDHAGCLEALNRAADCLIRYTEIPENEIGTVDALLQNRVKFTAQNRGLSKTDTAARWSGDPRFEPIRDTDEFRAILAGLTE
ncbi:MAG: helix-turn-helix transcriptional regulator [Clostridia bacterium]|nr:helix-turn-helix transcriptional regulator [Clostridia bacterium]